MKFFSTLTLALMAAFWIYGGDASITQDVRHESLMHVSDDGFVLFFDKNTGDFYLLQTTERLSVPDEVHFLSYSQTTGLSVRDQSNGQTISYSLSTNIYGISNMKGNRFKNAFIEEQNGMLSFLPDIGDVVAEASCNCIDAQGGGGTCDSGGPGSSSCSTSDSNGSCSVACQIGYYACCNNE